MNLTDDDLDSRISKAFMDGNELVRLALIELRELSWSREGKQSPCNWSQEDSGKWISDCCHKFIFNERSPKFHGFKFCPYCGKPITETPYKEKK